MYTLRAVLAAVIGPLVLAAFFLATSPQGGAHRGTLIIASIVLAHTLFWPAALATNKLALRMRLTDSWHMAVTMGSISLAVFVLIYIFWAAIDDTFSWKGLLRDSLSGAVASGAAYVLYRALLPGRRAADHARAGGRSAST